jgi:hypothetical protein
MGSELFYVMKHKNRYEKEEQKQRKIEIENLREDGLFRVALNNELDVIKNIFEDSSVEAIELTVDSNSYSLFGKAFGYEEMQSYNIRQKPNTTNVFIITKKEVSLY